MKSENFVKKMSKTSITRKEVIDDWFYLGLGKSYVNAPNRIVLSLKDIFANHGLKIVQDIIPDKLRVRYTDIVAKIRANKKVSTRPRYFGFTDLEKHFFSVDEFPDLCAKDDEKW